MSAECEESCACKSIEEGAAQNYHDSIMAALSPARLLSQERRGGLLRESIVQCWMKKQRVVLCCRVEYEDKQARIQPRDFDSEPDSTKKLVELI